MTSLRSFNSVLAALALLATATKPTSAACPSQAAVNTAAEKSLGCQFAVPPGYVPASAAEFDKQTKATTPAKYQANPKTHAAEVKGAGNGGIRCPKYVKTSRDTTIYRLYGSPGQAGKYGGYWTFHDDPHSTSSQKDTYRKHYAICTAWNDLSGHVACKLKKGVVLQVGPGESVHEWKKGTACDSVCKGVRLGIGENYKVDKSVQVVLHNADAFCDK